MDFGFGSLVDQRLVPGAWLAPAADFVNVGVGIEVGLPLSYCLHLGASGVSLGDSLDLGLAFSRYNMLSFSLIASLMMFSRIYNSSYGWCAAGSTTSEGLSVPVRPGSGSQA